MKSKQPTKVKNAEVGRGPNLSDINSYDLSTGNVSKSCGNHPVKTSGIKIRGTGAARRGVMARGPMA